MNNEPEVSLTEKILPSTADLKMAAGGLGVITAASCVGKYLWAKL